METPQLPLEVWGHILSFSEDWDNGRAWIHDLLCVNKYFNETTNAYYEELLTELRDEVGDQLMMRSVNERIRDRVDEKWFVCV